MTRTASAAAASSSPGGAPSGSGTGTAHGTGSGAADGGTRGTPAAEDLPAAGTPAVRPRLARAASAGLALVAVAAAVVSGLAAADGNKMIAVLPLAAVVALALAVLAMTRFASFVLLLLAFRSSVDLFKLSGASAGNTATNTAAARGLDPSSILAMLFLLASIMWLVSQYASGRRLRGSGLRLALVVFVSAAAISTLGSDRPAASALEVLRILSVVMMFVVLEQLITDRVALVRTLLATYAGMVVPIAYTLFGMLLGSPASEVKGSFTRITGPFSQSNTFARYLAFMIVFGVALYPVLNRRLKVVMVGVLGVSSALLVLTLTRGALLAAVVGVVVVAVAQRRVRLLVALGLAAVVALVAVPELGARFATLGTEQAVGGRPTGNSLEWRLGYWSEVLPLANENPVTGIGLNMTQYGTDAEKQPHNDFVRAYVETGLFGLGAYGAMHLLLLRNGWLASRGAPRGTLESAVGAGALGTAVCFTLGSLGANVMSNVVSMWYLVAFAAAASYVVRRDPATGVVEPVMLRSRDGGAPAASGARPEVAGARRD